MDVQVQLNQVVVLEFSRREGEALTLKGGANLYIIFPNFFQKLHEIEKKMDGEAQLALIGFDYLIDRSNYFLTYIVM